MGLSPGLGLSLEWQGCSAVGEQLIQPHADAGPSPQHLRGLHELWVGYALQAVGEELEGAALGQQHQQPIESLDQVGVVLHIQQLQAEIWERTEEGEGRENAFYLQLQ